MGKDTTGDVLDFTVQEHNGEEFPRDLIFHLLRNKRRRAVMFYLLFVEEEVSMRDLSSQVSAWENDIDIDELPTDKRETTHVSLYQTHLPTLDEHNIINYEKHKGIITADSGLAVFEPYMTENKTETNEIPDRPNIEGTSWRATALRFLTPPSDTNITWSRYYLLCAALGTVLVGGATFFVEQPDMYLLFSITITLGLLTTLSFIHVFYEASPEDVAKVETIILGKSYRR